MGSRVGHIFGSSRNVPKHIGIHPEVKASNLGIIKNPKTLTFENQKPRKDEQHLNCLPYFVPYDIAQITMNVAEHRSH